MWFVLCNVVTQPVYLVGKGTIIYSGLSLPSDWRPDGQIVKVRNWREVIVQVKKE